VLNLILLDCYNKIFGSGIVCIVDCSEVMNFSTVVIQAFQMWLVSFSFVETQETNDTCFRIFKFWPCG